MLYAYIVGLQVSAAQPVTIHVLCSVLRVNYAQPMKIKGGDKGFSHLPVWADADQYMEERLAEAELEAHARRTAKAAGNSTDDVAVDID
jgi:hypothetical protein